MRFRRLVIMEYGPPEVLQMVEGELPEPGAGMVRIRVLTAGVSFSDLLMRCGMYPNQTQPPFTPGFDVIDLDGRALNVNVARPRPERSGSGSGFGGGRGPRTGGFAGNGGSRGGFGGGNRPRREPRW